jgi:hypothetical protein
VETVGAQVSTDLRRQALFALLYAILGTGVYISGRFEAKWFVALGLAAVLFVVTYAIPLEAFGLSPPRRADRRARRVHRLEPAVAAPLCAGSDRGHLFRLSSPWSEHCRLSKFKGAKK